MISSVVFRRGGGIGQQQAHHQPSRRKHDNRHHPQPPRRLDRLERIDRRHHGEHAAVGVQAHGRHQHQRRHDRQHRTQIRDRSLPVSLMPAKASLAPRYVAIHAPSGINHAGEAEAPMNTDAMIDDGLVSRGR